MKWFKPFQLQTIQYQFQKLQHNKLLTLFSIIKESWQYSIFPPSKTSKLSENAIQWMDLLESWPTITFKPHQEIIWKNTWHKTTPSLELWRKFKSAINPSPNVQVCSQVPVNLVPDSFLAMGIILVKISDIF